MSRGSGGGSCAGDRAAGAAATRTRHLRAGAPGRDGDRQPHPGLVLRPGRDVRARPRRWTGSTQVRRPKAPTSSTSAASRPGYGDDVDAAEELRRTAAFVAHGARAAPGPGDQRRHLAGRGGRRELCERGADLLNDTWAGADPRLAEVAAEFGVGPGVQPHRWARAAHRPAPACATTTWSPTWSAGTVALAERAVALGVRPGRDPASTRRTTSARTRTTRSSSPGDSTSWSRPAGRCWSRCPTRTSSARRWTCRSTQRLTGTLAATAVSAWHGARVFRAHQVAETRQVLDMVASIRGDRPPPPRAASLPSPRPRLSPMRHTPATAVRAALPPLRGRAAASCVLRRLLGSVAVPAGRSRSRGCMIAHRLVDVVGDVQQREVLRVDLAVGLDRVVQPVEQPAASTPCPAARSGTTSPCGSGPA